MCHRFAQAAFSYLTALALLFTAVGCGGEDTLESQDAGQYYGFAAALGFAKLGIPSPRSSSDATANDEAPPLLLISEPNGAGSVAGAGSVYVFEESSGKWTADQNLFSTVGANRDYFGGSLATKDADVIVGASGANSGAGRAYVFNYANNAFTQQGTLQALDAEANDGFGTAVAIDGNLALVSAPFEDQNASNAGAVYAFARTGATWTQTQKLLAPVPDANDSFGLHVLLTGTEALIAAIDDSGVPNYGGRVDTWNLVSGVWTPGPTLKPSDAAYAKGFGSALARQGNWLIVGASTDDETAAQAGAAYVFERVGNSWVERQKLRANDGMTDDYFGTSVAIDGDYLVVGAVQADGNATNSGAAYVFELNGTWNFAGKLIAEKGKSDEDFGRSCAIAGDQVVVGAPDTTVDGFYYAGAGYVFTIPDAFSTTQRIATETKRIAFGRQR